MSSIENKNSKKRTETVNNLEGTVMGERDSRILADNVTVSNDTWKTLMNNNDLVVGGTGAGKTRGYIRPNIERAWNESIVVADTKGNLFNLYKDMLQKRGYRVFNVDFKNIAETEVGYNPLDYIRKNRAGQYLDQDIIKLGSFLIPADKSREPFWENSAQNYFNCATALMLETSKEEDINMSTLFEYAGMINTPEFASVIDEVREEGKGSYAAKCYRQLEDTRGTEKTMSSILSVMRSNISLYESNDVLNLFMHENQLRFETLGEEKTALFLTISDSDRSMDNLVNLMYTNMFNALIDHADKQKGSRLKVPVHFYMDDFATNTRIPDFDNLISVIRSREISVSIIIQNLEQLQKCYPCGATTIIANCDHMLVLNAHDHPTAQYVGNRIGKMITNVMNLPADKAILIESGKPYRVVDKIMSSPAKTVFKRGFGTECENQAAASERQ